MSSSSRESTRKTYWQAAGVLLSQLRARYGWTESELAERAGLSTELVRIYERDPERFPDLEAWWRLTTALGVGLETFLRHVEGRAGVRLLHDVRLPQSGGARTRGQAGGLTPREGGTPSMDTDQLNAFVEQLRTREQEGDGR